ncbi:MAG: hypothetical protein ACE5H4_06200 [Candidatus Thorarchaeota archaeon]
MTTHENPESPKLKLLRRELDGGNTDALETFWQEVASQVTPLIEPVEGDDTHSLVTFLWRAERELDGVAVIGLLTESFEVMLGSTSPTATTTTTTPIFDPDILSLVVLVLTVGFMVIVILVIVNYMRQRTQRRYQF